MTALASTAAARHDVLIAVGTVLFIGGAALLIGCLIAAAFAHGRRPAPLPVEPAARSRAADDTVVQYVVRPTYDPDATRYLPRQGGRRW